MRTSVTAECLLVGDVGGTHTRLALACLDTAGHWRISQRLDVGGEFPDFRTVLRTYFERTGMTPPRGAVIAAAGPVRDGEVLLTNRALRISGTELTNFGFTRVAVLNDFAALAYATQVLEPADVRLIGPACEPREDQPVTVLGAGTGFGVSCLVRDRGHCIALTTEGGHIGFAPTDAQQVAVLSWLQQRLERVSVERILSGPGLESLHTALQQLAGLAPDGRNAEQISGAALAGDALCRATLSMFCCIYGAVAGDLALVHGARGGVYIGGGIALKIEKFLCTSAFREHFERKGRMSSYVKAIPTRLILHPDATLLGAAYAGSHRWGPA